MSAEPVLLIDDLRLGFSNYQGTTPVLHGISLHVRAGEKVALVGESGSGKSVTARIIIGLLQQTASANITGSVRFEGREVISGSASIFRHLRGRRMSMIFQDPTAALNPVYTIEDQFREVLRREDPMIKPGAAYEMAAEALRRVSIHETDRVMQSYPFQLSGGMNQRIVIAMALANGPALLLADEPGTALDVTVQAQTLKLMSDLTQRAGAAVLLISHNLGVVREFADRVYVIYRGRLVEQALTADLFADPQHPYTKALLAAVPRISGGGVPELGEMTPEMFNVPLVVHPGSAEPARREMS